MEYHHTDVPVGASAGSTASYTPWQIFKGSSPVTWVTVKGPAFCAIQSVSARAFMTTRWIRRWAVAGAVVVIFAVLALPALSQPGDDDVLAVIPENYKLLFQNSFVRVIEARIPPGVEEKPHRHLRGVSVYMTNNTTETRILPDGQWVRSEPKAGTVNWSDASLHVLRNVGKTTIYTIRVELK